MDNSMVKCKGCKKPFERYGRKGILPHIKVAKVCLKSYTDNEVAELQKASDLKKKEYLKEYRANNKSKMSKDNKK